VAGLGYFHARGQQGRDQAGEAVAGAADGFQHGRDVRGADFG